MDFFRIDRPGSRPVYDIQETALNLRKKAA